MTTNNRRSTRRSFGRRALAFGVAMFAMVTLTAVGFAAWLISSNAQEGANGGIVTEDVKVASIKVTIENKDSSGHLTESKSDATLLQIVFAPKADKQDGDILQFDKTGDNDSDKPENLTFHANGTIENWDKVGTLSFSVRVPGSVITAAGLTKAGDVWSYDSTKAYVELPTYAMDKDGNPIPKVSGGVWDNTSMTEAISFEKISDTGATLSKTVDGAEVAITAPSDRTLTATFSGTGFAFKWGKRYDNQNPASIANTKNSSWGSLESVVGIEQNKSYTANQLFLELLRMNSVINNVNLENLYSDTVVGEASLSSKISALGEGKTIDDFVKESDSNVVSNYLIALQTKLNTAIEDNDALEYQLVIDAVVR